MECSVCYLEYDDSDRVPHLCSKCGQSICKECCSDTRLRRRCPHCRAMPAVFTPNRALLELLEIMVQRNDAGQEEPADQPPAAEEAFLPRQESQIPESDGRTWTIPWRRLQQHLRHPTLYKGFQCANTPVEFRGVPRGKTFRDCADHLLETATTDPQRAIAKCHMARGYPVDASKDIQGPFGLLHDAVRLDPNCAPAWNLLGVYPSPVAVLGQQYNNIDCFSRAAQNAALSADPIGEYAILNIAATLHNTQHAVPVFGAHVNAGGLTARDPPPSLVLSPEEARRLSLSEIRRAVEVASARVNHISSGFRGHLPLSQREVSSALPLLRDRQGRGPQGAHCVIDAAHLWYRCACAQRDNEHRAMALAYLASCFSSGRMALPGTPTAYTQHDMLVYSVDLAPTLPHAYNALGVKYRSAPPTVKLTLPDGRQMSARELFEEALALDPEGRHGVRPFALSNVRNSA